MRARGGAGHTNQTTNTPNPLHPCNHPAGRRGGSRTALPTKQPHPLTAATHSSTTIIPYTSSQPVGAGLKPALPTKHPHPPTAHQRNQRNQRNQRFRLDFHTTSVVQMKTSAQTDTSRTRRPETSPRRTGLCAQLFSMLQLPTFKQGSADGSPHGEPEATAQAEW